MAPKLLPQLHYLVVLLPYSLILSLNYYLDIHIFGLACVSADARPGAGDWRAEAGGEAP